MALSDDNRKILMDWMVSRFDNVEDKLEKHGDLLTYIHVTLAQNTDSLVEHMRRTNELESRVDRLSLRVDTNSDNLKPMIKSGKWLLGALTAIAVAVVIKYITKGIN